MPDDPIPPALPAPRDPAARVEPRLFADYSDWVERHKTDAAAAKGRATQAERERDEAKAAADAAKTDADARVAEAAAKADQRLIRAELRRELKAAGLVDDRDLSSFDISKLKLTDEGDVDGLADFVKGAKTERPHLFKSTSSHAGDPPPPNPPTGKKATEMTEAEWKVARATLIAKSATPFAHAG